MIRALPTSQFPVFKHRLTYDSEGKTGINRPKQISAQLAEADRDPGLKQNAANNYLITL